MDREVNRIVCVDEFGQMFVVLVIQSYRGSLPTAVRLELSDGSAVERIDQLTFRIAGIDKIIRQAITHLPPN